MSSSSNSNQANDGNNTQQPNWFERWSSNTPYVSRTTIIGYIVFTLISWLTGISYFLVNVPYLTLGSLQLWRLITSNLIDGQVLSLLFFCLMWARIGPSLETSNGSTHLLVRMATLAMLAQLLFLGLMFFLAFNPIAPSDDFLFEGAGGLWITLLAIYAIDATKSPDERRQLFFLPCKIPNKYFPWALIALMSIFSGIRYDLICGACVGFMYGWGWFEFLRPSTTKIQEWEAGPLAGLVQQQGYISANSTATSSLDGVTDSWNGVAVRSGNRNSHNPSTRENGNSTSMFSFGRRQNEQNATGNAAATAPTAFPGKGQRLGAESTSTDVEAVNNTEDIDLLAPQTQTQLNAEARREALRKAAEARLARQNNRGSPST